MKENQGFSLPHKRGCLFGLVCVLICEASFTFSGVSLKFAGISGHMRPNTLSCTCLSTNRILVSHQVPRTLAIRTCQYNVSYQIATGFVQQPVAIEGIQPLFSITLTLLQSFPSYIH